MKFSTREDIEGAIEDVFARISNAEHFEKAARLRGAEVDRVDQLDEQGIGMRWKAAFDLRGRRRKVDLEMVEFEAPARMRIASQSQGIDGDFVIDLTALSQTRTRAAVALEIKPKNLSSRLLIQSLRLAKGTLTKRYKARVAQYFSQLERQLKN